MRVHSFTLPYTPENMKCDSQASLLAHTLASPCLGREPKAKVATVFDSHNVTRFNKVVSRKENESTYMVYCNIFIDMHRHCFGGDLVRKYIGK